MLRRLSFYFYVFYCFEVGIFLLVVPWWLPLVWEQNYFFFLAPSVKPLFLNGYIRGAVSGLGVVNIMVGVSELIRDERSRRIRQRYGQHE